ncbi:MAG: hypothetical protein M3422_26770 [Actinomycetota bacterium]|nr:hypothetical protein [Actinomycetota bacterium]
MTGRGTTILLLAVLVLFAGGTVGLGTGRIGPRSDSAACASRPTSRPNIAPRSGHAVDADLESLTQDIGPMLGDRWAGAWANPDGGITMAITGTDPLPPEAAPLADHPKVGIVTHRFSLDRLSAVQERVVARLNDLLAPGLMPGEGSTDPFVENWPYTGGTKVKENVVEVTVDEEHRDRCREIEEELADELEEGTVRVNYGAVLPIPPYAG